MEPLRFPLDRVLPAERAESAGKRTYAPRILRRWARNAATGRKRMKKKQDGRNSAFWLLAEPRSVYLRDGESKYN